MEQIYTNSRRNFLWKLGIGFTGFALSNFEGYAYNNGQMAQESGKREINQNKVLGIALVGLGKYSNGELAPALQETKHCKLAGIVTGSPSKAKEWSAKYKIPEKNIYNYENFDSIKDNPDIDIIYVVLPNSMHAEYTIRAAKAGKHVICEKPMAITAEECEKMIEACKAANRKLSIGYRLHFEPYNLEMMRLGQNKVYGNIKSIVARNGFDAKDPDQWRLKKALSGGGSLMDVGIYCVQGARYTTGAEPISVTAAIVPTDDKRFREVEDIIKWKLEFPNGIIADSMSSYSQSLNLLRVEAEKGWFEISPSYQYHGLTGKTSAGPMNFPQVREQALQMDDFALCVLENRESKVNGYEGLKDVKILNAIYKAAKTGKKEIINLG